MRRLFYLSMISAVAITAGCGGGHSESGADCDSVPDSTGAGFPDTLRVATLYSPASYFIYRDEEMGYDYALVSEFAADKGMELDIEIATSLSAALEMLDSGKVDLIAYEVPVTTEYNDVVRHCGPVSITTQVLVQPRGGDEITDVTGLVGRDIYVEKDSKYQYRLANLNNELGGGISVHAVDRDTLITEDLIAMVSTGEIPLTVVDSDIAKINKTYYPNLNIGMPLSFEQRARWAVSPAKAWLADSIDAYFGGEQPRAAVSAEYKRYFELSKSMPSMLTYDLSRGVISPYDDLFRQYAGELGWDWRLLASQAFVESRFDNNVVSWAGARGIMQIMPGTARANGADPASLTDPATSVRVAVKVLKATDNMLRQYVPDDDERRLFVLAAYNSGAAHVIDAIALARKYGLDDTKWTGSVEEAVLMKAHPQYYNDPVVKYGYFRGRQTTEYVRQVMAFYKRTLKSVKP